MCLRPLCLALELEILSSPKLIDRIVLFRIAYQVAEALRFLHDMGVIYRDLKPENVLVWSLEEHADLHVKLIDFCTGNFATSTGLISCAGSPGNHAPEMLESANKEEYTFQVDVYSYAILLYRIITRLMPFIGYDSGAKINAPVIAGERPQWQHVFFLNWNLSRAASLVSDPVHACYGTFRFNSCPWRVCLGQRLLHFEWVALQVRGIHEIRPTS